MAISELSYPSMYQNITGGNFLFVDDTTDRAFQSWEELLEPYYLAPGLYPSIADVVKAMNKLISEREKNRSLPTNVFSRQNITTIVLVFSYRIFKTCPS